MKMTSMEALWWAEDVGDLNIHNRRLNKLEMPMQKRTEHAIPNTEHILANGSERAHFTSV